MIKRYLEVRNMMITLCQTYRQVIDDMIECPESSNLTYILKEALEDLRSKFLQIENTIAEDNYDPENIVMSFADVQRSFFAISSVTDHPKLLEFANQTYNTHQTYNATYSTFNLNAMKHNLTIIMTNPERYSLSLNIDTIKDMLKEIDLITHIQNNDLFGDEIIAAKVSELVHVFFFNIMPSINAMLEIYHHDSKTKCD